MQKRGQITIMIIIGIVILMSFGLLYHMMGIEMQDDEQIQDLPAFAQPVQAYVEQCLQSTLEKGIEYNLKQGGYYVAGDSAVEYLIYEVPFYYYIGEKMFPDLDVFEKQLGLYMADNLGDCLGNFSSFAEQGFRIRQDEMLFDIDIRQKTEVMMISDIEVSKDSASTRITSVTAESDIDILKLYDTARYIIVAHDADLIPFTALNNIMVDNKLQYELINMENGTILYSIIENSSTAKISPLTLNFAAKYGWDGSRESLEIEDIQPQAASTEYDFEYAVKANRQDAMFSDDTELFEISEDGVISFTPQAEDAGMHHIIIRAESADGLVDYETMELMISNPSDAPYIPFISDQYVDAGETFAYNVSASDADGDMLLYSIDSEIAGLSINPQTGEINYAASEVGEFDINVTVVDINGMHYTRYFRLVVQG